MTTEERVEAAKTALENIGAGWRTTWADFDGRTLRSQLQDVAKIFDPANDQAAVEGIVEETADFLARQEEGF